MTAAADTRLQRVRALSQTPITDRQADWLAKKLRWWFAWMDHKKTADHKTFSYLDYKAGGFKNADEVAATGLLKKTGWSRADGLQRGWILTPAGQATHEALAADPAPKPTPAPTAAPRPRGRPRTRAVDRYGKRGNRAPDLNVKRDPQIDIDLATTAKSAYQRELKTIKPNTDREKRKITRLQETIADLQIAIDGEYTVNYRQDSHGRFQGQGMHLQSTTREAKSVLFAACFDIDIASCHVHILLQIAHQHGIIDSPALEDLAHNKKRWRSTLADYCDADIDEIKQCLLAIIYSARITGNNQTEIVKTLGKKAALRFNNHPDVVLLYKEIAYIRQAVVRKLRKNTSRLGNILNAQGLPIHKSEPPKKIMAHICQGIESLLLQTIIDSSPVKPELAMHDGIIVDRKLSASEISTIETIVKKTTGFNITLDIEPLNAGFQAVQKCDKGANAQLSADLPALPFQPEYLKELEAGQRQQEQQPLTERCSDNSLFHVIITAINFGNTHTENCTEFDDESENTPRTTGPPHTAPPDRV